MGNRPKQMASLLDATPLLAAATGNRRIYRHLPPLPGKVWTENQCVLSMTFLPSEDPSVLWDPFPVEPVESRQEFEFLSHAHQH